jgi:hypothetical protein
MIALLPSGIRRHASVLQGIERMVKRLEAVGRAILRTSADGLFRFEFGPGRVLRRRVVLARRLYGFCRLRRTATLRLVFESGDL